jgi:excisionase family DNA binding protein
MKGERAVLPNLVTLAEAADELGITPADVSNPVRHVRDLIRRHGIPFTRCGRTVKLRPDQLRALAERMVECPSNSNSTETASGTLSEQSLSGVVVNLIQKKSGDRQRREMKQRQTASSGKSRTRQPSAISPVENPLSRSAKRRLGTSSKVARNDS